MSSLIPQRESAIKQIKMESIQDPLKATIDNYLASLESQFIFAEDIMITRDSIATVDRDLCRILTSKAMPCTDLSEITLNLFLRMENFIEDNEDVDGISLPQLGVPLQAFTARLKDGIKTFVNPHVFSLKGKQIAVTESCLSIPGREVVIERANNIKMLFRDLDFKLKNKNFSGDDALLIQHMFGHLRGNIGQ